MKTYISMLRLIACVLVLFNHTEGYILYMYNGVSYKQLVYLPMTMLTRINVPLFFMISGALLLGKEESVQVIVRKRMLKMLGVLLLVSCIAYVQLGGAEKSLGDFVGRFIKGDIVWAYWYLYAYVGFLLMLPFLRIIVKGIKGCEAYCYLIFIHFLLVTVLPIISYLHAGTPTGIMLSGYFAVPVFTLQAIFFPLLGYGVDKVFEMSKLKKRVRYLVLAMIVVITIESLFTLYDGEKIGYTQNFVGLFDYVLAICVFLIIKFYFAEEKKSKVGIWINEVSSLTFGVYVLDPIFKPLVGQEIYDYLALRCPKLIASCIYVLLSFVVCACVTYGVRYLVRRLKGEYICVRK